MSLDVCCACSKPIYQSEARYGASFEPMHWRCRPQTAPDRERERLDRIVRRGEEALADLKRKLAKARR